jgi:1,4-dihydroxy-2-naphthoyl-CoA hydrolase
MSPGASPDGGPLFAEHVGVEYLELGEDRATARIEVSDRVRMPYGIVHGAVHTALAESLTSYATNEVVRAEGMLPAGQSSSASILRPISEGHVNAEARVRHRGRTSWVWEVEITDDEGRLCALVVMTLAIRPRPEIAAD